jgi:ABC-type Na+ efflux pump permease subunit
MLPGPILRREVRAAVGRRHFTARTLLAAMLVVPAITIGLLIARWRGSPPTFGTALGSQIYAAIAFAAALVVEFLFLPLSASMTVAASIAEEREKDTLPLLLLTRLTPLELVATKLVGRLVPAFLLLLAGLPLVLGAAWAAGLPALLVVESVAVLASTVVVSGSLGILASARRDHTATACFEALAWTMLWFAVLPIAAMMPVRSGTLWGDLLIEFRRLARWLAAAGPMSLMIDRSWLAGMPRRVDALSDRLLTMLAMQAVIIVAAVAGAVAGLRRREPHPAGTDLHRGARPLMGDDPIFWREYQLTRWARGVPLSFADLVRRLVALLRSLLELAAEALLLALLLATFVSALLAAGWFGYFAFREQWGFDRTPLTAPGARDHFNWLIRAATAYVALLLIVIPDVVGGRIVRERNKKTWESLLMTPLTGPEILSSKMRVAIGGISLIARWLIPLWLLGIACGAVHPLGALLAAAVFTACGWLCLALSLRMALRPGATMESFADFHQIWLSAVMVIVGPAAIAALCTARELDILRSRWVHAPWIATAVLAVLALATAAQARWLTRRCFERFDEWVGRPHRARGADRAGGASATTAPGPAAAARAGPRTPSVAGVE